MALPGLCSGMGLGREETFPAACGDCRISVSSSKSSSLCCKKALWEGGSSRVVLAWAVRGRSPTLVLFPPCSVSRGQGPAPSSGAAPEGNQSRDDPGV